MRQSPEAAEIFRQLADTLDGPVPVHSLGDLYRLVTIVSCNADPAVFTDGLIANEARLLAVMLEHQIITAEHLRAADNEAMVDLQLVPARGRPTRRVWALAALPTVCLVYTVSRLSQTTSTVAALIWAWGMVSVVAVYALLALAVGDRWNRRSVAQ